MLGFVQNFGPEERRELFVGVGAAFEFMSREGLGIGRGERSWPPPLLVLAGLMLAGFLGLRALRRIPRMLVERREARGGAAAGRVIRATFYEEAIRNVAARGMVRSRAQSPREFMQRASPLLAERAVSFREITNAFEGVRYGEAGLPPEEEERLEALARTLLPDSGGQRK